MEPTQSTFEPKKGEITKLVIKLGLAKDQAGANKIMIAISVCSLLLMTYFLISTYNPGLLNFSKPRSVQTPLELEKGLDATRSGTVPTAL